jgi:ribitol 2-dehydrogenase
MAKGLDGKIAAVTGGASGIGLASAEAMLAAGARVVLVDRDEAALTALREKHGDAVIPLVIDLLDAKSCATLMPQIMEKAGGYEPGVSAWTLKCFQTVHFTVGRGRSF